MRQYIRANLNPRTILGVIILAVLVPAILWGLSLVLPPAVDWHTAFRPATLKLVSGHSPYEIEGFFNPAWTLIPLIPIAILPEQVGRATLFIVTIICFAYTAHRLDAKLPAIVILLLSPPAMHGLLNGNIDWLAILGLIFPPQIGLFFVTIKPQIGIGIAVFWVISAWQEGGWKKVVYIAWPITAAFLASLLIFGLWPLRSAQEVDLWWNASLWPASIPVGLTLLVTAIRQKNISFAMGASPCLSPYVLLHSWIIALFGIVHLLPELLTAVIGLWILVLIQT